VVLQRIAQWLRRKPAEAPVIDERPVLEEFIHVRVGSEDRPASDKDVQQVTREMNRMLRTGSRCLVTHHAVRIEVLKLSRPIVGQAPKKKGPRQSTEKDSAPTVLDTILQDKN
jgi:hypothetical protein